jgi:membrane fusion protein, multidrug efflux system
MDMATESRSTRVRNRRLSVVLLVSAILVVAAGSAIRLAGRDAQPAAPAERAVPVQLRTPLALERQQQLVLSGEVEARRSVAVGFRVGGLVARVAVEEGQAVREGDLLAALDPEDYRLQLELAQAAAARVNDQFERAREIHSQGRLTPADYTAAETGAREARAHEQMARRALENTRLLAPFTGIVAHRGVQPGEQAGPGVPVFTIVDLDPVRVRVGVPEREIGRVRAGLPARVAIPSLRGWTGQGVIDRIGVVPDPVSRTYPVRIAVPNPAGALRPGMIADVRIDEDARVTALTLPGEAIVRDASGVTIAYVYFPAEGRVFSRRVEVGSVQGREVEILGGIGPDELVVVGGQHRVRDGARVEATVLTAAEAGAVEARP